MEVTSTIKEEEVPKLNVDIDDIVVKEDQTEHSETEKEKSPIEEDAPPPANSNIDYDDEEDSGDDFAVITKTSTGVDSSPAKNLFSIKTISNTQIQSNYKISKTAIDLEHPGNVNGVPTVDYDLSKLTDDCKPWKKPGADVSDFFNYGFTEETWLLYCEKQKALRMTQDNAALKTLSGLTNFGYNLSGSHIHMNFNRNNPKMNKGGIIDVIGSCQQNGDYKNKQHDMGMSNKISTIPVQTGHMNMMGQNNQPGMNNSNNSYMAGLANQALNNNLLNPLMLAMGMIPNAGQVNLLNTGQNMPIDVKMSQYGGGGGGGGSMDNSGGGSRNYGHNNWSNNSSNNNATTNNNNNNNNQDYDRHNSVDSMHSHEEYGDKKSSFIKSDRGTRRNEHEESHRYRSRDKREKSPEKRRRTRSRERGHDSKYARSSKRNRTPEDSRRHKKYSRERSKERGGSSDADSSKRHRGHRSSKKTHRQSRSRSRSNADSRKERRHRHKSVHTGADDAGKVSGSGKPSGGKEDAEGHGADRPDNSIKREKETSRVAD